MFRRVAPTNESTGFFLIRKNQETTHTVSPFLHHRLRQASSAISFRLVRAPSFVLRQDAERDRDTTDRCLPSNFLTYVYPYLVSLPAIAVRAFTLCTRNQLWGLASLDRRPGASRHPSHFGGSPKTRLGFCYSQGAFFFPQVIPGTETEPLTPLSPLPFPLVPLSGTRVSSELSPSRWC